MLRAIRLLAGVVSAFALGSIPAVMSIVATQSAGSRDDAAPLILFYLLGWFLLFGVAAALGSVIAGLRWRAVAAATAGCAAGGALSGLAIAVLYLTGNLGGSVEAVLAAFAVPLLGPWLVGAGSFRWFRRRGGLQEG